MTTPVGATISQLYSRVGTLKTTSFPCVIFSYAYHNDTVIKTDAMNNRQTPEDFFRKILYLSLYCKGSKRVIQGLRVRGSWRSNKICNILTPTLMAVNVVSFSFSGCSTGDLEAHSAG